MILLDHKKNPLVLIVVKQVNLVVLPVIINNVTINPLQEIDL